MSLFVVNSSVSPPPSGNVGAAQALINTVASASMARATVTQHAPGQVAVRLNNGSQVSVDAKQLGGTSYTQQLRTAVLPDRQDTGVLFSASQRAHTVPVSDDQVRQLSQELSRVFSRAENAQVTLKAQVSAVRPDAVSLQLSNGQTLSVPLRLAVAHQGEQVILDLTRQDGRAVLSLRGTSAQSQLSAPLVQPDKGMVRDVVNAALRNAGITVDAKALSSLPSSLSSLLPAASGPGSTVQHQVTFAENSGKLSVQSALLQAVGRFAVASGSAESLGRLDSAQIDKASVSRLPLLATSNAGSAQVNAPVSPTGGLSTAQRNDVHQHIIALSRQLLAETGSTRTALTQLMTILDSPPKNASPATQALLTTLQTRVRGLEQGTTFSAFRPQATAAPADTASAPPTSPDAAKGAVKGANLLGNMAQRMKDLAALLQQAPAAQQGAEAASQSKNTAPVQAQPQTVGEQVKALLNAQPLPLSASAMVRPSAGSDLVSALVTMVQFSLAGRAINRQPSLARQADRADSMLSKSLTPGTGSASGSPARIAQDMAQLDSRGTLLQSLKTLLANHQQAALTNADNRLQGQDSLYYMLPLTGTDKSPPELLIRRDQQGSAREEGREASARSWNLTMKLDVGDVGELLAKSRLEGDRIELDLYASSEQLLHRVADTLPFFTRKLEAHGLDVTRSSFQRGKVPETLDEKPHHIFETMV